VIIIHPKLTLNLDIIMPILKLSLMCYENETKVQQILTQHCLVTSTKLTYNLQIPMIINGIIKNSDIQNSSKTKSIPPRAKPDKSIKCHHKAHIIGDSHLKGCVTKINPYLNTDFVVSSFIKPRANIKQMVHNQETEFNPLNAELIAICHFWFY